MDFSQGKLTATEWNSIEIMVSPEEKYILSLIREGYNNITVKKNKTMSFFAFTKIQYSVEMEKKIYQMYFDKEIKQIIAGVGGAVAGAAPAAEENSKITTINSVKIKRADAIRMEHLQDTILTNRIHIFEFNQLEYARLMFSSTGVDVAMYFYTLIHLNSNTITHKNQFVQRFIQVCIDTMKTTITKRYIIEHAPQIIERNLLILKYTDMELYRHQKDLFTIFKYRTHASNLVLYSAPTGTGKTMSPIGLSEEFRVIFVCVARHVGLALARAAISVEKRVAFAFNCETAGDVKLHYFAAKDYTRDRRSGGIRKVDNSVGDKVEMIICDVKSYLSAMHYMKAFNPIQKIILFWDEPTITLDVAEHPLHELIHQNWAQNEIPNIVLSCATLPKQDDLEDTISNFRARFDDAAIHTVTSCENRKSVSVINKEGNVVVPHTLFPHEEQYEELQKCVCYCNENPVLMKYLDLAEVVRFILTAAARGAEGAAEPFLRERYLPENYFDNIEDITMDALKRYYLLLLQNIKKSQWTAVVGGATGAGGAAAATPIPSVFLTTSDAYSLTDGPTIYLCENIEKISQFFLQQSNIPETVLHKILEKIHHNDKINLQIKKIECEIQDIISAKESQMNESSAAAAAAKDTMPKSAEQKKNEIERLQQQLIPIMLEPVYIPNTQAHLLLWHGKIVNNAFTSDVNSSVIEEIVNLEISNAWKILLLMGIGSFSEATAKNIKYTEIMKQLAYEQKLFMIIASSDYIYGINYQFSHGIIGRDLATRMTPQKMIQAVGRVGRNSVQQEYTLRFRDNSMIKKLFCSGGEGDDLETKNMNRLFNSA